MRDFKNLKRVVVKVGSSSLVNKDLSINKQILVSLMSSFKNLQDKGIDPLLVTSGAVALGMHELNLDKKPKEISLKQACAAIGQAKLMENYNKVAEIYDLKLGQILLSHDDFSVRKRMLHLTDTLDSMFKHHIIPVINENDALAIDEIKVGDNDTLSALIAPVVNADLLILFSDIDGLFDKNPKIYSDAKLITEVSEINDSIINMAGDKTSNVGTGGMNTKIDAALIATKASVDMIICNSNMISKLEDIVNGKLIGTYFKKSTDSISSRDHWLIFRTKSQGAIVLDDGACLKLSSDKKVSILPKGIVSVKDEFLKGSIIEVLDKNDNIIAKGITNYSSSEIELIKGKNSDEIKSLFSENRKKEVVHANDLVVFKDGYYGRVIK
ncbi:MAG: glutamate 5-kinase [Acholeplasmatales bacterium]|nr:glutamate 5-kinase [Acholeplasmatales bacterium]